MERIDMLITMLRKVVIIEYGIIWVLHIIIAVQRMDFMIIVV